MSDVLSFPFPQVLQSLNPVQTVAVFRALGTAPVPVNTQSLGMVHFYDNDAGNPDSDGD